MTDYKTLIDAETWAFIDRTNSFYPPDTIDYAIAEQRAIYRRLCREFFVGYPDGVTAETTAIPLPDRTIPIRIYRTEKANPAARVVYFHGGGFMLGGLDSHDDICAELCARTGYELIAIDYRLAPDHKHPAAFDDARAAFEWAARLDAKPVVLCGDSAGGNLAAAVSHAVLGHANTPIGQVLIYPGLGGERLGRSYVDHANAPMLTVRDLDFYRDIRGGDGHGDVTQSPLSDTDYARLPPTVSITAECDPLSSDGETYRDRIRAAGGKAFWREEPGLVHGYLRGRHTIARARDSFSQIVEAVSVLGRGAWPYMQEE